MFLRKLMMAGVAASSMAHAEGLPVNSAVNEQNIYETICSPGWAHTVRPPASYSTAVKKFRMREAGLPLELMGDLKLDHVISISAGGSPDDVRNLVLEDADESYAKDKAERRANKLICSGEMPLRQAQRLLWTDWRKFLSM